MRAAFRDALLKLAAEDERVIFLTGDLGFGVFDEFMKRFPTRYINVGVAEAQLVTCGAGLALEGWKPIVYSIASFMTGRAFEQIRIAVGYHELPVVVVGAGGGYTYASSGVTHHAKEDLALMALIPGMAVMAPGDPCEVEALLPQALNCAGPSYLRIGKFGERRVPSDVPIVLGRGRLLRAGSQVAIVTTGSSVVQAMDAAEALARDGVSPVVAHFHTLTPFDRETFRGALDGVQTIVVVEDHGVRGGLGSVVQAELAADGRAMRVVRLGPPDERVIGNPTQADLLKRLRYDAGSVAEACREAVVGTVAARPRSH